MAIQKHNALKKGIDFETEYLNVSENEIILPSGKFSPIIRCDEQRIMQVLLGLQSNALKFTTKGKIKVSVGIIESEEVENKCQYVQISVEDTGIGISEQD